MVQNQGILRTRSRASSITFRLVARLRIRPKNLEGLAMSRQWIVTALVLMQLAVSCSSWPSNRTSPTSGVDSGNSPESRLVDKIIHARNMDDAISSTTQMLEQAGIAVSPNPESSTDSVPPAGIVVSPEQLEVLAVDAKNRASVSRIDLDRLAAIMRALGAPNANIPTLGMTNAGLGLELLIARWVSGARAAPKGPSREAPLFLAALAAHQDPPIDLATPAYSPGELRLGQADLILLWAGLSQMAPAFAEYASQAPSPAAVSPPPTAVTPTSSPGSPAPTDHASESQSARPSMETSQSAVRRINQSAAMAASLTEASGDGPCSSVINALNGFIPFTGAGWAKATKGVVAGAVKWWTTTFAFYLGTEDLKEVADGFEKFLSAADFISKVQELSLLYGSVNVEQDVLGPKTVAQPINGGKETSVRLTAGIDDRTWRDYQSSSSEFSRAIHDCARSLDLPNWTTAGDLAPAVQHWTVQWSIDEPDHVVEFAEQSFNAPGLLANYLAPVSDHAGQNTVTFAILSERGHDHTGPIVDVPVTISTETTPNTDPSEQLSSVLSSLVTAGVSLPSAFTGLAVSAFAQLASVSRSTVLHVTHHQQRGPWVGYVRFRRESTEFMETDAPVPADAGTTGLSESQDVDQGQYEISGSAGTGNISSSMREKGTTTIHHHELAWLPCSTGPCLRTCTATGFLHTSRVSVLAGSGTTDFTVSLEDRHHIAMGQPSGPTEVVWSIYTGAVPVSGHSHEENKRHLEWSQPECGKTVDDSDSKDENHEGPWKGLALSGTLPTGRSDAIEGTQILSDGTVITYSLHRSR